MKLFFHCVVAILLCLTAIAGGLAGKNVEVHAKAGRTLPTDIQLGVTPADVRIIEGDHSGITGIGDFNGDGLADILIEYIAQDPFPGVGTVVTGSAIVFGKSGLPQNAVIDLSKNPPDLTIPLSGRIHGGLVHSITLIGDLNGDGIDDLGVTVIQNGKTSLYGFFGSRSRVPGTLDLSQTPPDLTVLVPDDVTTFGGVIDLNGDGRKDLILKTGPSYDAGDLSRISVLFGPYPSGRVIDLGVSKADVVVIGSSEHDLLTPSAGDVNGDGVQDLLISIVQSSAISRGIAVIFGSPSVAGRSPIAVLEGQADALLSVGQGSVLASADVNGDGIDDIVAGEPVVVSPEGPPFFPDLPGSAAVVFGSKQFPRFSSTIIQGTGLLSAQGIPTVGDHLGESIAVRDIDGDGIADIIVGAPAPKLDQSNADAFPGQVYVVLGSKSLPGTVMVTSIDQDLTIRRAPGTFSHVSLAGSGDFNGDGISDIVVESFPGNVPQGTAYIFFGAPLRAPEITSVRFKADASQLILTGTDFNGAARLEVNGLVLAARPVFERDGGKLTFTGSAQDLNFHPGKNKIFVIRGAYRSNTIRLRL
jgi:hypothetical protein